MYKRQSVSWPLLWPSLHEEVDGLAVGERDGAALGAPAGSHVRAPDARALGDGAQSPVLFTPAARRWTDPRPSQRCRPFRDRIPGYHMRRQSRARSTVRTPDTPALAGDVGCEPESGLPYRLAAWQEAAVVKKADPVSRDGSSRRLSRDAFARAYSSF